MDESNKKKASPMFDADKTRATLVGASIFIALYEALKDRIIEMPQVFFTDGIDERGRILGPEYKVDVLARNKSPVYASIDWFRELGALDDADIAAFERAKICRNILSHELVSVLVDHGVPADYEPCFLELVRITRKLEVWWVREIEMTTNPEFDGMDVHDDEIEPGMCMLLDYLCRVAFADQSFARLSERLDVARLCLTDR